MNNKMMIYIPITVPKGEYCWFITNDFDHIICEYFDNEGGDATCLKGLGRLTYCGDSNNDGIYLKGRKCLKLSKRADSDE